MPTTSKKQQKLMLAVANSPKFAKKVGIAPSVGKKMIKEDKKAGRLGSGGTVNRVGDAVTPSRRDPDIDKLIKEAAVPTTKSKFVRGFSNGSPGSGAPSSSGVSRLRRSKMK